MKKYTLINNILGWVIFLIATTVYLITAEPTASWWDCGEYIATADKLQVGHPPGAPTFQLIGSLFSNFAGSDTSLIAYTINAMSAVCSGFTILFLFWSITMLAKKFDPVKFPRDIFDSYYVTLKLDGNRCIAYYDEGWHFISRSGKPLRVNFDMTNLPTSYIYDGEILSEQQLYHPSQANFNTLSGILNSKNKDKSSLCYVIFDVIEDIPYYMRREILDLLGKKVPLAKEVYILPAKKFTRKELLDSIEQALEEVTSKGGEGLMINLGSAPYIHTRTDQLLKVKQTFTMDMEVKDVYGGTGKNEGLVGALHCIATDCTTGRIYECNVGSGLNDEQRYLWAQKPEMIIGKIVEVAYFSISQDKNMRGSLRWSLRFPRLKRVRLDKTETSVD